MGVILDLDLPGEWCAPLDLGGNGWAALASGTDGRIVLPFFHLER